MLMSMEIFSYVKNLWKGSKTYVSYENVSSSAKFAIFVLSFDEILSEFRVCFQKMENNTEIGRILPNFARFGFPENFDTE